MKCVAYLLERLESCLSVCVTWNRDLSRLVQAEEALESVRRAIYRSCDDVSV